MIWLIAQMWAALLAAFVIGVAVGWWIWGPRNSAPAPVKPADETGTLADDGPG